MHRYWGEAPFLPVLLFFFCNNLYEMVSWKQKIQVIILNTNINFVKVMLLNMKNSTFTTVLLKSIAWIFHLTNSSI